MTRLLLLALSAACNDPSNRQQRSSRTHEVTEPCDDLPINEWAFESTYWYYRGFYACARDAQSDPREVAASDREHALAHCIAEDVARYYEPFECEVAQCIADAKALALAVEAGDRSLCRPLFAYPPSCEQIRQAFRTACSPTLGGPYE